MNGPILRRLEMLNTASRTNRLKSFKSSGADASINITPLVDVVLVLLIIFMVVTPMINDGLELPFAANPERVNGRLDDVKIVMKKSGEIKIGDNIVPLDQVAETITKELSKNPGRAVYLSADKALQFVKIRELLGTLRDQGVSQAGLVSTITPEES
ncbi:MAG: biopolymer transporter ExbD [Myxococcota bacterium]